MKEEKQQKILSLLRASKDHQKAFELLEIVDRKFAEHREADVHPEPNK